MTSDAFPDPKPEGTKDYPRYPLIVRLPSGDFVNLYHAMVFEPQDNCMGIRWYNGEIQIFSTTDADAIFTVLELSAGYKFHKPSRDRDEDNDDE